jgi:hypothetical protein
MFDEHGRTPKLNVLDETTYHTIDPEGSKDDFATYSFQPRLLALHYEVEKHLWNNGFIVVDEEHWKQGRELMKSSFEVVHLANFDRLRRHVDIFMKMLHTDDSAMDIIPRLLQLVHIVLTPSVHSMPQYADLTSQILDVSRLVSLVHLVCPVQEWYKYGCIGKDSY